MGLGKRISAYDDTEHFKAHEPYTVGLHSTVWESVSTVASLRAWQRTRELNLPGLGDFADEVAHAVVAEVRRQIEQRAVREKAVREKHREDEAPEIEAMKPPVGSYVARVFRVDGYDPDCGQSPETASMARLSAVYVDGETTGWQTNCVGLYNTTDKVIEHPRDVLG